SYQNNYNFENLVVYKNEGNVGAGFSFLDNAYATITNCIFAKNNNTSPNPGIAILASNPYFTLTLNTRVFNTIFIGNTAMGSTPSYVNSDFNWQNSSSQQETIPLENLAYSVISGNQTAHGAASNIYSVSLRDIENGAGNDNTWMTADDGLQATGCSNSVDNGNNYYVQNIPLDILGDTRIRNLKVDIGPYEASSNVPITSTATITASDTIICTGSPVTFYATATATSSASTYQWKVNGVNAGTNSYYFLAPGLSNGDIVKVVVTINNPCVSEQVVTSNSITIQVPSSLAASAGISSSANPACSGSSITFRVEPVLGGTTPAFQWKVNGSNAGVANSYVFISSTLSDNDTVSVVMTSSLSCVNNNPVSSNAIIQRVNAPLQPDVMINSGGITCAGTSPTLTANPVNGGANPAFQWKVNGVNSGTNSNTYTSNALKENDVVVVVMTSNAACVTTATATSSSFVINFSAVLTPSATIATPSTFICTGVAASFSATAVNGGDNPVYQWQVNGVNAGGNSGSFTTSSLLNNSEVKVVLTSNAACVVAGAVTSNSLLMTVSQPEIPTITISGNTTINPGQSSVISSSAVNAGTAPSYQWQDSTPSHNWLDITGALSNNISYTAVNSGDRLRCLLANNTSCNANNNTVSNELQFTVNEVPGIVYPLRLYPNPVISTFTIDTLKLSDLWSTIEITGADGRLYTEKLSIANKTTITVNVSQLIKGIYFAVLRREDGELVFIKFMKD
ncbi:MAG: T9SS type A sorting domain-containing protein, partial [Ferruginibacter sp.]